MYKCDCFQDYRKLVHLLAPLLFLVLKFCHTVIGLPIGSNLSHLPSFSVNELIVYAVLKITLKINNLHLYSPWHHLLINEAD